MSIMVVGVGYVGLVAAAVFAAKGFDVVCIDKDEDKINKLKRSESIFYEPELENILLRHKKKLIFDTDMSAHLKKNDIIILAVGTPENEDGSADLKYIYKAIDEFVGLIEKDSLIIVKSTVPIGTCAKLEKYINDKLVNGASIEVVSNPEFLSQGTAVNDMMHPSRIILGVDSKRAEKVLRELYKDFEAPIVVTDRTSAEMIKYASNCFLALKISYINEIANLCEKVEANIEDVTLGMGYDKRIGKDFLKAGVGYGGSCFPKDTKALYHQSRLLDSPAETLKAAIYVNNNQVLRLLEKSKKYIKNYNGIKIAILGVTFKQGTDDLRESPAIKNINLLMQLGARISVWDKLSTNKIEHIYGSDIEICQEIDDALCGADACFIFTAWEDIIKYDISKFKTRMNKSLVFDGRNCFSTTKMHEAGITYESIGRV